MDQKTRAEQTRLRKFLIKLAAHDIKQNTSFAAVEIVPDWKIETFKRGTKTIYRVWSAWQKVSELVPEFEGERDAVPQYLMDSAWFEDALTWLWTTKN